MHTTASSRGSSKCCVRDRRLNDAKFRRQVPIGNYIIDFVCQEAKLIIELDGSQHLEQQDYDEERTKYLEAHGYRVLRFWNNHVTNDIESVLQVIWNALDKE